MIHLLRQLFCFPFLAYASMQDCECREVSDYVWLASIPLCLGLDLIDVFFGGLDFTSLFLSLAASLLLGFALCFVGFYGGADGWALLLLALAVPAYPGTRVFLFWRVFPLPVLFIFVASSVFSLIYPITCLALNVVDRFRGRGLLEGVEVDGWLGRLVLNFMARRRRMGDLRGSLKYFPAETLVEEDGGVVRRPMYFTHAETDIEELYDRFERHETLFEGGVLATPTIPMIVFLTAGYLLTILIPLWPGL